MQIYRVLGSQMLNFRMVIKISTEILARYYNLLHLCAVNKTQRKWALLKHSQNLQSGR